MWFDGVSLNSIVIERVKGVFDILDMSELIVDMKDMRKEISTRSLRLVDEFTLDNYSFYEKRPVLVALLDSIIDIEKSK